MLTFIVYFAIAAFVGIAVLGHIFVLQAIFTSADHADGRRDQRVPRSWMPDLRI
jgi:hypothetical protein